MSIALFLLTFLFPPRVIMQPAALPSTVAQLSPRPVALLLPRLVPLVHHTPRRLTSYRVTATVYSARKNQTDSEPFVTADNSRISRHHTSKRRWMALSRDMLKNWGGKFDFGDSVRVKGISPELDGVYVIHDTMNRRLHRTIDLLVGRHEKIYGKWDDVTIKKVEDTPPVLPEWQAS
ncbi:hypothetical protein F1C16_17110 [Hymenobacter sp. NBH84]|uniref:hypothetical protein n=1 Tax=Hymenobacter sp. NBH84 TaxID=2596915 RepID=UPI0016242845|nr:hypothetical protein [Hymenobacter sp. NBH84]QNE41157.1 hypothetical protein F1C16_17110 [Hymenobacter sp. NBH84]